MSPEEVRKQWEGQAAEIRLHTTFALRARLTPPGDSRDTAEATRRSGRSSAEARRYCPRLVKHSSSGRRKLKCSGDAYLKMLVMKRNHASKVRRRYAANLPVLW
ncbi:hypothetical protein HAX54_051963 [Datura stramonium]|uniref:Uncharacterized protein n=1 Tax=Datura stramonium TaxID=4076 RepID=A0ABS8SZ73_DATST|nr:hypothetical protein [Datura stramonium]